MTYTPSKSFTVDEFVAQYGEISGYELADGELIDMEPTGPHETVGGKLAAQLGIAIAQAGYPGSCPVPA
jgi:Uma2 family endonuclease